MGGHLHPGVPLAPPAREPERASNDLPGGPVASNPNENPTCVFCRIIGGDEMVSVIHEDDEIIAFLDIQPLHPGHVLVMPKEHFKNLFYVPEQLAARTFAVAKRILPGLRKATGCRAI